MDFLSTIAKLRCMQYLSKSCWLRTNSVQTLRPKFSTEFRNQRSKSTALNLAHRIFGPTPTPDSVPIFVLHDCLGTKNNWFNICLTLTSASKLPVIAVDARNHGDSPYCNSHDYKSLAADVAQLISDYAVEKCIIIGHSMGGRTGMVLALNEPSKIASLVVIDISPVSTSTSLTDNFPKIIDTLMTIDFKGLDLNQAKAKARNKILETNLFQNEAEIQALLMNIGESSDQSVRWKFNLDVLKKQFNNIITFPDIRCVTYPGPTLFVAGKLSYCIPSQDLQGIYKLFPAARLLYIDGVGHNVHLEDPNGLVCSVLNFFDYNSVIKMDP